MSEKGYPPGQGGIYPQVPPAEYPSGPPPSYTPQAPVGPPAGVQPVIQTVVIQAPRFGRDPVRTTCSNCRQEVTTTTIEETGVMAYVAAGIICVLGCWCGCCLIPFCMDSMKDVLHTCPNCNAKMGKYKGGGL